MQRLREEEQRTKAHMQRGKRGARLLIILILFSFSLLCLVGVMATIDPLTEKKAGGASGGLTPSWRTEDNEDSGWCLLIVNRENYIPADFIVDLKKIGDIRVDYRIADPLETMIADADRAGIALLPVSGYRSVSEQRALYDEKKAAFMEEGYGEEAAEIYTRETIQPPGASEHHTGLAVDFLTTGVTELKDGFAQSPAYQWLMENGSNYGFIQRYPADKTSETGVSWEPWHFRYVGTAAAKAIGSMAICLEEYM